MNFSVHLLPDEPVVLLTMGEQFQIKRDLLPFVKQLEAALDAAPGPVYVVDDATRMELSFADMVRALGTVARGDTSVVRHPNIYKIIFVTTNDTIRLGGNALRQAQYGAKRIEVVTTLEHAFAAVRAEPPSET